MKRRQESIGGVEKEYNMPKLTDRWKDGDVPRFNPLTRNGALWRDAILDYMAEGLPDTWLIKQSKGIATNWEVLEAINQRKKRDRNE